MSSESDPDEFYDAEDVTPRRLSKSSIYSADHDRTSESSVFDKIAAEELQLLESKRVASERRKEEDEDIERKLEALANQRKDEKHKVDAAQRAEKNEKRRLKLQEARQQMTDDGSPTRPPAKPPRTFLYDHAGEEVESPEVRGEEGKSQQVKGEEVKGEDVKEAVDTESDRQPAESQTLDTDSETQSDSKTKTDEEVEVKEVCDTSSSKPDQNVCIVKEPELVESRTSEKSDAQAISQENAAVAAALEAAQNTPLPPEDDSEDVNVNSPEKKENIMQSKNIPELLSLESNIEHLEGMSRTRVTPVLEEPDIIQITKSSSLPRSMPAPPVAPPRRKKKNRNLAPPSSLGGSLSSTPSVSMSELETPTTTVYSLTEELEKSLAVEGAATHTPGQSLDLNTAVQGDRIVTAVEEESAKGGIHSKDSDTNAPIKRLVPDDSHDGATAESTAPAEEEKETETETKGAEAEGSGKEDAEKKKAEIKLNLDFSKMKIQRPRTNSGSRYLTDAEILEQVHVLNLDTGEHVALSEAEDKLPKAINPLSLHIMRRTKEYSSDSSLHRQSDDEDSKTIGGVPAKTQTLQTVKPAGRRKAKIKKLIGKTVHKIKMKADEVFHGEESSDDDEIGDGRRMIKIKAAHSHKGPYDFDLLVPVQDLHGERTGAIWTMKCSPCGRLLATGGQDNLLRIWVLKDAYTYFDDMRQKYNETKVSPAPSQDSLNSQSENVSLSENSSLAEDPDTEQGSEDKEDVHAPFMKKPFCVFKGHTADLLDVSWSKNYFVLSSSMDKTVRLWHVSRKECLCCFQHIDFVTAIAFHPKDDRYFLSGSLDGKLRLWNIPDKKVALWNEVSGTTRLITAANFCLNGRFAVVGTYDGRCVFYNTDQLKYFTQIHVRSTRGKNSRGRKITGVEAYPGEDKLLVTSNDSRIRLYDLRDLTLTCKYKGCANNSSQIKASFSSNGKFIVCGSEDQFVYIWRLQHEFYKFSSARRDRNDYWEGIKAHMAVVTTAIFAPQPRLIIKPQFQTADCRGEVLISADYTGAIKVFINKFKPGSG